MGLQGSISSSLANLSYIETIDLSANALNGSIPPLMGSLSQLKHLSLRGNRLGGTTPSSLVSLSALVHLDLARNMLSGQIPNHIANLTNLTLLDLSANHLNGTIPSLKGLQNLERLFLQKNQFVGAIPDEFGHLEQLYILKISHNKLSGRIPQSICNLGRLKGLFLHHNHLSDVIPVSLGYCTKLQVLDLSHNSLIGSIPQELGNLFRIKFYVNLSFNYLQGALPQEIGKLVSVRAIDISHNRLNGVIPQTLGNCTALQYLNLSRNGLEGSVPNPLGNLKNLRYLDLSSNFLSGTMPLSLKGLKFLRILNFSFNCLAVDEDERRFFVNSSVVVSSFPACGRKNSFKETRLSRKVMGETAAGAFCLTAFIFILGFVWTKKLDIRTYLWTLQQFTNGKISYKEIKRATAGFSDDNLLGRGNFGSVYKGILDDGREVAVKVLDSTKKNARNNFTAECNALRHIRHRNVVKIITTCSSSTETFMCLLFRLMCNGSLESHLYPRNHSSRALGLEERLNIALDIAHAIEYLHHQCGQQIVHCDIKPSNVLLDEDLTAYLSDFGIAKLKGQSSLELANFRGLKGTVGYIAPEYGVNGRVSTRGDVYSYGILLLEMLTSKKPTHPMFQGNFTLRKWVSNAFQDRIMDIVDQRLDLNVMFDDNRNLVVKKLLRIGLWCSEDSPQARLTITEALSFLKIIKDEWEMRTSRPQLESFHDLLDRLVPSIWYDAPGSSSDLSSP
ncbi:hypothetical protein SUGI_0344920 [Cryptomeria japonica]|nr:putative leucine-rich repeat receptor-like serine/threonine-protein kinase At2g24130 isoform X2 [Cryptomeria japonica]GLJ19200.1 hypothetical protein SUGI_0344920 [Cryptomeria japonica]